MYARGELTCIYDQVFFQALGEIQPHGGPRTEVEAVERSIERGQQRVRHVLEVEVRPDVRREQHEILEVPRKCRPVEEVAEDGGAHHFRDQLAHLRLGRMRHVVAEVGGGIELPPSDLCIVNAVRAFELERVDGGEEAEDTEEHVGVAPSDVASMEIDVVELACVHGFGDQLFPLDV